MDKTVKTLLGGSKIERAKRLKGIRDITEPESRDAIMKSLMSPSDEGDVTRAIDGLSQEDEFALMCRMMETTTHIVRLDQTPIVRNGTIAPDFLVRFQPGCYLGGLHADQFTPFRSFVEVKSTTEQFFKIGGAQLAKRRAFAQAFDLPLLFAVRFLNVPTLSAWVIVDGSDETQTTIKVSYTDDVGGGYRCVLWDDFLYMPRPGLKIERVYDPDAPNLGNSHPDYGNLVELRILLDGGGFSYLVPQAIPVNAILRCFGLCPAAIRQEGTAFIQTLRPTLIACFLSDAVFKFNRMITDEIGQVTYDASRIIALIDEDHNPFFDRSPIHMVALDMLDKEILFLLWPGEQKSHIDTWQRLGGTVVQP